ncbi:MAG: TonB-dependent receptor [Moraxella sp.]|nr:TonB-dependent receptor [Moraxella sp.]
MFVNRLLLSMMCILYAPLGMAQELSAQDKSVPSTEFETLYVNVEKLQPDTQYLRNHYKNSSTLGGVLEAVSGVQSTSFGAHSGAPMIRSLSGNRVNISENGVDVNGLNAISAGTNIAFDPVFYQLVGVHKSSDVVLQGGQAIGGSVAIDSGLVARQMADKPAGLELYLQKGFNMADSHGIKANINNQKNMSVNILHSAQSLDNYNIVGNSKASVCDNIITVDANGRLGNDPYLTNICQKEVRVANVFNMASREFYDSRYYDMSTGKYSQEYYDDDLAPSDIFKRQPNFWVNSIIKNPLYVKDTPEYEDKVISTSEVTENYYKKLGNSDLKNSRTGISATYFLQDGYVAFGIDSKRSRYGLTGYSANNLGKGLDHKNGTPVRIGSHQDKYVLESEINTSNPWLSRVNMNLARVVEKSTEDNIKTLLNSYTFDTWSAKSTIQHTLHKNLSGVLGVNISKRDVDGDGEELYLPNVKTDKYGVFLQETLDFGWVNMSAGYRHELVKHDIKAGDFKTGRNKLNVQLDNQDRTLNSHELKAHIKPHKNFGLKVNYAKSERAPEINELYASGRHYSIMAREEGNQLLKKEVAKNLELTALFNFDNNLNIDVGVYRNKFFN